jgi:hypothetical protein
MHSGKATKKTTIDESKSRESRVREAWTEAALVIGFAIIDLIVELF